MREQTFSLVTPAHVMAETMAWAGDVSVQGVTFTPLERAQWYASLWKEGDAGRAYWTDVAAALQQLRAAQESKP